MNLEYVLILKCTLNSLYCFSSPFLLSRVYMLTSIRVQCGLDLIQIGTCRAGLVNASWNPEHSHVSRVESIQVGMRVRGLV